MLKTNVDLLNGKILKSLIIFSIPMFISNLFQQLYNTMDVMIVGNYLGDTSLAAIGACGAIFELLIGFTQGVGNGLSIVIARCYGSGDKNMLKKAVAGSLIIGTVLSIIVMIISQMLLYPLLGLLDTPKDIINQSYGYISFICSFVIIMFMYNLFAGALRAIGNSVIPLVFLIISAVLNVLLDIFFIVELNMGIKGTAVATVISQGISAFLCLIYIYKKCKILIPSKEHFIINKTLYKELLAQGLSMGIMLMVVSAGTVILQGSINSLGKLTIAAHTTARKINSFAYMPLIALAVSLATFVSQNKGANQIERIKKSVKYANILSVVWGIIAVIILMISSEFLVKLLSGSNKEVVINNATKYLFINSLFYPVLGILFNLRNSLQGLGEKILPLASSVIELVGKIVFVIILIPTMKYLGVIWCEPIIWCFMCIQLALAYRKSLKKDILY